MCRGTYAQIARAAWQNAKVKERWTIPAIGPKFLSRPR